MKPLASLSINALNRLETYSQSNAEELQNDIRELQKMEAGLQGELEDSRYQGFKDAPLETQPSLEKLIASRNEMSRLEPVVNLQQGSQTEKKKQAYPIAMIAGMAVIGAILGFILVPGQRLLGLVIGAVVMAGVGIIISQRKALQSNQKQQQENTQREEQITRYRIAKDVFTISRDQLKSFLSQTESGATPEVLLERWKVFDAKRAELNALIEGCKEKESQSILAIRNDPDLTEIIRAAPIAVLRERIGTLREQRFNLNAKRDMLEGLKTGSDPSVIPPEDLKRRMDDNLREIELREEDRPTLKLYRDNPGGLLEKLEKLGQDIELVKEEKDQMDGEERQAQIALGTLQATSLRDPLTIQEELDARQEEFVRLTKRKDAIRLAVTTLQEAIQEYESGHLTRLSELTSSYFRRFTGDRYSSVEIRVGLDPVIHTANGQIIAPDILSQGACDQLYLALRLAILDLLGSGAGLPVILDDTFVNYDDDRLAIARQSVEGLAQDHQVILLSHNSDYLKWKGTAVPLTGQPG